MRGQRGVELRRVVMGKSDPPTAELLIGGLGDRGLRLRPSIGFGSRFQLDRGAQLVDRGHPGQLQVMLLQSRTGASGDDPDLIQRQPTLPHARHTPWELLEPAHHRGDRVGVGRRRAQLPGQQRRHRPCTGHPAQLVAIDLGGDLHDAPINRIALTGQLRQLRNNTAKRSFGSLGAQPNEAVEDITTSSQRPPTTPARPISARQEPRSRSPTRGT
ncbi:hypothetical protein LAUMK4_00979 [Mycobacterium persicum]|uniref:Uncharacterized protein n=1 Tax=Mycobacterium persicum TaxID=1487726 RepID=A0ABY6RDW0_9MYCO|nr:hypothetical protein LAUMK15_01334 [Mycobacterium persicum]VAZ89226.1 hypothetical protein LAUMK4_00979 [Mycobacterium persicum]